jgi:hypothetical protein
LDYNGESYSPDASFFNVSPATSKFRNVYEQIDDEWWRKNLMDTLGKIALYFRHPCDDTRRHRHIETDFRETAMWSGPVSQLGYCKRLLYCFGLHAEWRKQVEELVVALKALTAAQASKMAWEMLELLDPGAFRTYRYLRAMNRREEEKCVDAESARVFALDIELGVLHSWKAASWDSRQGTVPRQAFIRDALRDSTGLSQESPTDFDSYPAC